MERGSLVGWTTCPEARSMARNLSLLPVEPGSVQAPLVFILATSRRFAAPAGRDSPYVRGYGHRLGDLVG
jgi:hypothetical protein